MEIQNQETPPESPQNTEPPQVSADAWLSEATATPIPSPSPAPTSPPQDLQPTPQPKRGRGRPPGSGKKHDSPATAEAQAAISALMTPDVLAPACVGFIDKGMVTLFSLRYGDAAEKISVANDADKKTLLVESWKAYLATLNVKLTPAQALVVTCALVYGEPIPQLEKIRSDMKKSRAIN